MDSSLANRGRKVIGLWSAILLVSLAFGLASTQFLAVCLAERPDPSGWNVAARLDPANAEYRDLQANYAFFSGSSEQAVKLLDAATALNPHKSEYWLDLAKVEQSIGRAAESRRHLADAIANDPNSTTVAWQAGSFFWSQNEPIDALNEFRVVLASKGELAPAALENCWQIKPDAGFLLTNIIPQDRDSVAGFLEFLISKNDKSGAAAAWSRLVALNQPIESRYVLEYMNFLFSGKDIVQAKRVWKDSAKLTDTALYQPSAENLVVNGSFELPSLNYGFDWHYDKSPGVTLSLDQNEFHSGNRSLAIEFDSTSLEQIPVAQFVAVEPNTDYRFEAFYKTERLEGVTSPQVLVWDGYSDHTYFASDEMRAAGKWTVVQGNFHTAPDAQLLTIRIERTPLNRAIRGKLWLDDIRLTPLSTRTARQDR